MGVGKWPLALAAILTTASFAQDPETETLDAETLRGRDRSALLDVRTVVMAGRGEAPAHGPLLGAPPLPPPPHPPRPAFPPRPPPPPSPPPHRRAAPLRAARPCPPA